MGLNGRLERLEQSVGSGQCRRCGLVPGSPGAFAYAMHVKGCVAGPGACEACRLASLESCPVCGGPEGRIILLNVVPGRGETA